MLLTEEIHDVQDHLPRCTSTKHEHLHNDQDHLPRRTSTRLHLWIAIFVCVLLVLVGSDVTIRWSLRPRKNLEALIGSCYCGRSVAEAKRLGCKYDSVTISWLPLHCFDEELSNEFNSAGPGGEWPYYADLEGTRRLTLEEVALLADTDSEFFTTHLWHLTHCNYVWRKLLRSLENGIQLERSTASMSHIEHCATLHSPAMHNTSLNSVSTAASNSFSGGEKEHMDS